MGRKGLVGRQLQNEVLVGELCEKCGGSLGLEWWCMAPERRRSARPDSGCCKVTRFC